MMLTVVYFTVEAQQKSVTHRTKFSGEWKTKDPYHWQETSYHPNVKEQAYTNVTEVWKLSNDGKSITVQYIAKSNIWDGERSWKTLFNKTN